MPRVPNPFRPTAGATPPLLVGRHHHIARFTIVEQLRGQRGTTDAWAPSSVE